MKQIDLTHKVNKKIQMKADPQSYNSITVYVNVSSTLFYIILNHIALHCGVECNCLMTKLTHTYLSEEQLRYINIVCENCYFAILCIKYIINIISM